jgi:hypothetical protein
MPEVQKGSYKLADFMREPSYERRVVVFYDFLGWQNHIDISRNDPKKLGFLRRMLLRHPRMLGVKENLEIRYSTFSDNVAITQKVGPKTPMLIQQLANFQLGAALPGFLLRGGITIGEVVHDDEVVFGPGLNRAYHLESRVAKLPRLVLDPLVRKEFGDLATCRWKKMASASSTRSGSNTVSICDGLRWKTRKLWPTRASRSHKGNSRTSRTTTSCTWSSIP